jgi:decaprenyl-phosphate phosphoribosyltransferase
MGRRPAPDSQTQRRGPLEPLAAVEPLEPPSVGPQQGSPESKQAGLAAGLIRTARPRQWIKNLLVFVAPGAAGVLLHPQALARSVFAFGLFCLAASATYFMNDAIDAREDRAHPVKCHRPVASGVVSQRLAAVIAGVALPLSIAAGAVVLGPVFALALGVYAAVNVAYSFWLKQQAIFDIAAVASGFLIRAIAGGLAVGVPLSDWFLIVSSFGSLFIVAGKRQADLRDAPGRRLGPRRGVTAYTQDYLRSLRGMSAGVMITAYCLWAFGRASAAGHREILFELTIVPFVLAILRYGLLVDTGQGGRPEEVVLRDRCILALGAVWVLLFAWAAYA